MNQTEWKEWNNWKETENQEERVCRKKKKKVSDRQVQVTKHGFPHFPCERPIAKTHKKIQCAVESKCWYHKVCSELSCEEFKDYEKKVCEKWICDIYLETDSDSEKEVTIRENQKSKVNRLNATDILDNPIPTNKQILDKVKKMLNR